MRRGGGGTIPCIFSAGGVLLGFWNPHPIPDHVWLILQPYTRQDTYPRLAFFCLLLVVLLLVENHLSTILSQLFYFRLGRLFLFWVSIIIVDLILHTNDQFPSKWYPNSRPKFSDFYNLKTIAFTAAHTHIVNIWEYLNPPPPTPENCRWI